MLNTSALTLSRIRNTKGPNIKRLPYGTPHGRRVCMTLTMGHLLPIPQSITFQSLAKLVVDVIPYVYNVLLFVSQYPIGFHILLDLKIVVSA